MLSLKLRQISYYLLFICFLLANISAQTSTTILEEDFENGWNNWSFYVDNSAVAESWIMNENNSKVMHSYISDEGTESWHVHLRKDGLQLQNGKTYKFTFDAYCESGWDRYINVTLEKSIEPYTNYSNADPFLINGTKQTFEYSFVMTEPTENTAGFCIEMGYFEGTNDPIDVVVDNIKIEEIDGPTHTVTIESPSNGTITNQTPISVSWSVDGVPQTSDLTEALTEGNNTITRTYTDSEGNVFSSSVDVTLDTQGPTVIITSPVNESSVSETPVNVAWTVDGEVQTTELSEDLIEGYNNITRTAADELGNETSASVSIYYYPIQLPPDPVSTAPELSETEVTSIADATDFIYTGSDAIQTGVVSGTIDEKRVSIIRGKILTTNGDPLPGATISIVNHPEFGQTVSRLDGEYDLAVNGGGSIILKMERDGYFDVHRQVNVDWRDYSIVDDVVMIQPDPVVTPITMNNISMQVARASVVTDDQGARQATIFFPSGVNATNLSDDVLNVRATEYTVGDNGPNAMPADMPSHIGYTYCTEFSVDGADWVSFNKPVFIYLENFLNFPVGGAVPAGYFDKEKSTWIASQNGRVINILAIENDVAQLDVEGNGIPADAQALASLGIDTEELQNIASTYNVGQSLWRVPIQHFTPWDLNWPYGPPPEADPPECPPPWEDDYVESPCYESGSIIEVQNQILGEVIDVTGTPVSLHYTSDRVSGRRAANTIRIPVSTSNIPEDLKRIDLEISIAGRKFKSEFGPLPNQSYQFTWNGKDVYGREISGKQRVKIAIGYVYDAVYMEPAERDASFGEYSATGNLTGVPAREEIILWQRHEAKLGQNRPNVDGIGNWTISMLHSYDPVSQVLQLGNGTRRTASNMTNMISTVVGNGLPGYTGDGGLATNARLGYQFGLDVGPDGAIYVIDYENHVLRKVDEDGVIRTIAGNGSAGYSGDGGPAINSRLRSPVDVAVGSDGSVYIADDANHRVRKIDPFGIITTVAGNGSAGYSGDGGPATSAQINRPYGVAVGPNDDLYILDHANYKVRRVDKNGIITTVVGNGGGYSGDGGPAINAQVGRLTGIAIAKDGRIFISDYDYNNVRVIGTDGIINTFCGAGYNYNDGIPASQAGLNRPRGLYIQDDNSLIITGFASHTIRKVGPDGIINTVAGTGVRGYYGDNGPAANAELRDPTDVAMDPMGNLYIADSHNYRVRKISPALPDYSNGQILIPSSDASQVFVFSSNGKHLQTLDALTNAEIFEFTYNSAGNVISIKDRHDNITTIERDGSGIATAIVGPYSQRTTLGISNNNNLTMVTNPAGERIRATYTADGLMTSYTNSRNFTSVFTYDVLGRLIKDENSEGGYTELQRTDLENGFQVKKIQNVDDIKTYETVYTIEKLANGATKQTTQGCCGGPVEVIRGTDGAIIIKSPDSTVTTIIKGPDPRFGMQSPIVLSKTVVVPSGLTTEYHTSRSVTLSDEANPLSVSQLVETFNDNGDITTVTYNSELKEFQTQSAEGKTSKAVINDKGQIILKEVPNVLPVTYSYDANGRMETITQGTGVDARTTSLTYNTNGYVENLTNALSEVTSFDYDLAGRVIKTTLPDLNEIEYSYDENNNITGITPPGKSEHVFDYSQTDNVDSYNPPLLGGISTITQYAYNLNKQLTGINRADGQNISFAYDDIGRILEVVTPTGTIGYVYNDTTNNLTDIATAGGNINYSYDGSLLTKTTYSGNVSGNIEYSYNNKQKIETIKVNGANPVVVEYDNDGKPTGIGNVSISYDNDNGRLTGTRIGSIKDTLLFNEFGEFASHEVSNNSLELFKAEINSTDKLGRITSKTETINGVTNTYSYSYDQRGQLTTVLKDGNPFSAYTYDSNGNRQSFTGQSSSAAGTYDEQDRMVSYGNYTYTYNDNGELQSKTNGVETTNYSYDVLGNLLSVSLPSGTLIEYVVDGNDRRIGKKVNGSLVKGFIFQSKLRPIAELDNIGNVVSRFVYGTKINVPDYMEKGGITYKLVTDYRGSVRMVVDVATGNVVQQLEYDEFGRVLFDSNPGFQPFGFAGGLYDYETGLIRFGVRDYDAESGRWTSKDPIGFNGGDTDLYRYCGNDPVNYIDITGRKPGDTYPTQDIAAGTAMNEVYENSVKNDIEYAGWIIKDETGGYSYTKPIPGKKDTSNPGSKPKNACAFYHSHGKGSGNNGDEVFSVDDIHFSETHKVDGYVITPNNDKQKYTDGVVGGM